LRGNIALKFIERNETHGSDANDCQAPVAVFALKGAGRYAGPLGGFGEG
jgi:hypothetical protein